MDLVLGNFRDERAYRADDVWGLKRSPQRELALDLVERCNALAGLEWARMHAWIDNQFLDRNVSLRECRVGCYLVAGLPVKDVVVMLSLAVRTFGLVLDILADDRRVICHCLERIDVDRQRLVFYLDQVGSVGCNIALLCDHERSEERRVGKECRCRRT